MLPLLLLRLCASTIQRSHITLKQPLPLSAMAAPLLQVCHTGPLLVHTCTLRQHLSGQGEKRGQNTSSLKLGMVSKKSHADRWRAQLALRLGEMQTAHPNIGCMPYAAMSILDKVAHQGRGMRLYSNQGVCSPGGRTSCTQHFRSAQTAGHI